MELVASVTDREEMWIAAVLHDVIEDCSWVTANMIERRFGPEVAALVVGMTKVDVPGSRSDKKAAERARLAAESADVQTIKCADLFANSGSIKKNEPAFWDVFSLEAQLLLCAMEKGDRTLWQKAALAVGRV
jgi:(p)ppGpp synthase/HD superfamily hydrolase